MPDDGELELFLQVVNAVDAHPQAVAPVEGGSVRDAAAATGGEHQAQK